jgi:hypothetical protein
MIVARGLGRGAVAGALVAFGLGLSEQAAPPAATTQTYYGSGQQQSLADFKAELAAREARRRKDEFELIAILGAMIDEGYL